MGPHSPKRCAWGALSIAVVGALLLVACGGAEGSAPKAASPAAERAPESTAAEPRTVEEAQAQIDQFSAQLGAASKTAPAQPAESTPPSPPPPPPKPSSDAAKADSSTASTNSCASPCRALASMRRAVDALCRMTGDTDNRCVDAKKTLADSVGRTSSCKCS